MGAVRRALRVKIELHADPQVLQGDILLFDRFSRFKRLSRNYCFMNDWVPIPLRHCRRRIFSG